MLSLIGREIRDHIVFVLAPCIISAIMIALAIRSFLSGIGLTVVIPLAVLMSLPLVIFCVLGAAQMYGDRAHKVSALLGTLAVTRNRILGARILVGVLTILVTIVPLVIAAVVLLRVFVPGAEFWYRTVAEVSVMILLTGFACYCAGLSIGWTTSRAWLLAGNLLLLVAAASLVYIKGFGPGSMAILLLFTMTILLRVWHQFTSASL